MKIIDFHQHLMIKTDPSGEELVRHMGENGVEMAVVHGCPTEVWSWVGDNSQVLKAVQSYPDRLIGSVHVDPRNVTEAKKIIKEYHSLGFRCVKMFPPLGFYPDDPNLYPVFELIQRLGLLVLFHMGPVSLSDTGTGNLNSKYARPIYVDGLARTFLSINFVLAHMGQPWFWEAASLAKGHPNIYLDCSSGQGPLGFRALVSTGYPIPFDKVLWGLDGDPTKYASEIKQWEDLLNELGLEEHRDKIFCENAQKLLDLVQ